MLPLLAQDPLQALDIGVVELPVARRRALGVQQALALQEADLGDGDVGELLLQEGQADAQPDRTVTLQRSETRPTRTVPLVGTTSPRIAPSTRPAVAAVVVFGRDPIASALRSCSAAPASPTVIATTSPPPCASRSRKPASRAYSSYGLMMNFTPVASIPPAAILSRASVSGTRLMQTAIFIGAGSCERIHMKIAGRETVG